MRDLWKNNGVRVHYGREVFAEETIYLRKNAREIFMDKGYKNVTMKDIVIGGYCILEEREKILSFNLLKKMNIENVKIFY